MLKLGGVELAEWSYSYSVKDGIREGMIQADSQQIKTPAFFPVTTYGGHYPLDELVRPYVNYPS